MKRFPCIRDAPRCMKIYDGHNKLLAEFKPSAEQINLYDQKNDKVQYTICHKPNTQPDQLAYNIFQDKNLVAEVTPSTTSNQHVVIVKVPKYGDNIEVSFPHNKTDFIAKRKGTVVSTFEMTSENAGSLDIAKGERRNFSFAFMTLFAFWCEELAQAPASAKGGEAKPQRSKSKNKNTSSRSGRSEEKSKEKEKAIPPKKFSSKAVALSDPDISEKSEESERSASNQSEKSENSDSSSNNDAKRKKRSSTSKTPRVISARTSIPLRSTSALKSPRGQNSMVISQTSTRKTGSSNSVLNALLKNNQVKPVDEETPKNDS